MIIRLFHLRGGKGGRARRGRTVFVTVRSVPAKAAAASLRRFASAAALCVRFLLPRVAIPASGT